MNAGENSDEGSATNSDKGFAIFIIVIVLMMCFFVCKGIWDTAIQSGA